MRRDQIIDACTCYTYPNVEVHLDQFNETRVIYGGTIWYFNDFKSAEQFEQDLKHFMRVCLPFASEYVEFREPIDFLVRYPMFAAHVDEAKRYAARRRAALKKAMESIRVADGAKRQRVVWLGVTVLGDRDGDGAIRRRIVAFAALF